LTAKSDAAHDANLKRTRRIWRALEEAYSAALLQQMDELDAEAAAAWKALSASLSDCVLKLEEFRKVSGF